MGEPIRFVGSVSRMMRALLAVVAAGSLLAGCSSSFDATRDAQSSAAQASWRSSVDAIGKPIRKIPITPEDILAALHGP